MKNTQLLNYSCSEELSLPFLSDLQHINFIDRDGIVRLYPDFFSLNESDQIFRELEQSVNWKQEYIKSYGRTLPLPRLTSWYGDEGKSYFYSGIKQYPQPWIPVLEKIKKKIQDFLGLEFNSVLINLYRHGQDGVSWHSDDEPELGINPVIASVSFGETRRFCLKHKQKLEQKVDINLTKGSLLVMAEETQHYWLHQGVRPFPDKHLR